LLLCGNGGGEMVDWIELIVGYSLMMAPLVLQASNYPFSSSKLWNVDMIYVKIRAF